MNYVLLVVGFFLLVKGADWFVDGSASIARKLHIPAIVIGLTIVSFGTSAPEAAVSITAGLAGQNDIALGNIIGSNIFNILAVIGAAAFIHPIRIQKSTIQKEFPFAISTAIVLLILSLDTLLQGYSANMISRADGLIMLIFFAIFLFYLFDLAFQSHKNGEVGEAEEMPEERSIAKSVLLGLIGVTGIVLGGTLTVDSAEAIALSWGLSEKLVGLTILAVGTSLPEFVTSVVAAKKGENDIAIGNVLGSNVFNVFFILAASAALTPIAVAPEIFFDLGVMLVSMLFVFFFSILGKDVNKWEGAFLFLCYIAYMVYIVIRN